MLHVLSRVICATLLENPLRMMPMAFDTNGMVVIVSLLASSF